VGKVNAIKIELAFIKDLNFVKSQGKTPCGLDWTDILKKDCLYPFLISSWMKKEKSLLETSMEEAE